MNSLSTLAEISTIIAAVFALITFMIAIRQLNLMSFQLKEDVKHKSVEQAKEVCKIFSEIILPHYQEYKYSIKKEYLPTISDGGIKEFVPNRLTELDLKELNDNQVYPILNKLDLLAISINNGSADEEICKQTFGMLFCEAIETYSSIIESVLATYEFGYNNAIQLYLGWRKEYSAVINTSPK